MKDEDPQFVARALPLTRRAFLGTTAGGLAATGLGAQGIPEDFDLSFDFSEDRRYLTVSIIMGDLATLRASLQTAKTDRERFEAWQRFRQGLFADDVVWTVDARKFGPEARFEVRVEGIETSPEYRLEVLGIRYGREANRTLTISFKRFVRGGRRTWAILGETNVWSGSQTGAFFDLGATTTGRFLDFRAFVREDAPFLQTIRRSRATGFFRRVSNTLIAPIGDDTLLRLHPNGDWTYGGAPNLPFVRAMNGNLTLGRVRVGWCLGTSDGETDDDPMCVALGDASASAVVAFGDVFGDVDITYGSGRSLRLTAENPDASPLRAVMRTADRDEGRGTAVYPRVSEMRIEAVWTARVEIDGVETGPFKGLRGILARRAALPISGISGDPVRFDNAVEFSADFTARDVVRFNSALGTIVALGLRAEAEEEGVVQPLFRNLSGGQFRAALRSQTIGASNAPILQWLEANLELVEAAFALPDAHYSRLIFDPTEFRVLYEAPDNREDNPVATETGQYQGSFLALGPVGLNSLRGYFGLSRAKLYAARADDMACMNFRFQGLGLAITDSDHEIVMEQAVCGTETAPDLTGGVVDPQQGPRDTRPLLVAEFPPQHVLEEACFVPAPPPLPDLTPDGQLSERTFLDRRDGALTQVQMPSDTKSDFTNERWLVDPFDKSAISVALSRLVRVNDRKLFREEVAKVKIKDTADDTEAFLAIDSKLSKATAPGMSRRLLFLGIDTRTLPADQKVYIGPIALDPDTSIVLRQIQRDLQAAVIDELVTAMFAAVREQASRLAAAGEDDIRGFETNFSAALALEGRLEAAVPSYQLFRSFYRDQTLDALQSASSGFESFTPDPLNIEFGVDAVPVKNGDGATYNMRRWAAAPHPLWTPDHVDGVIAAFGEFLTLSRRPTGLAHARNASPSRLAFRVSCRDRVAAARARVNAEADRLVDALDQVPEETLGLGRSRMPFTMRALTDWSAMELSVVKRAANVYSPGPGGRLDARSGRTIDLSEAARLRSLGYTEAGEGGSVDAATRLGDIERSMKDPPGAYETAIEIPARLQLSPSDTAVFLNRRGVIRAIFEETNVKVTEASETDFVRSENGRLWTARLHTDGLNPGLRAIHSQDFRPDFVWGGARLRQGKLLSEDKYRLPGGSPPPAGNIAPWMIGSTEGLGITPEALQVTKDVIARNPNDADEWSADEDEVNFSRLDTLLAMDPDERAFCKAVIEQADAKPYVMPRLIELLCRRSPYLRRWSAVGDTFDRTVANALFEHLRHFRAPLSANDRHQLVVLSSAYGLPVTGRLAQDRKVIANSGQIDVSEGFAISDLLPGDAIYRPAPLEVSELSLSTLGGSLRLDTSFEPPVAALQLDGTELFDTLSVEKWQQWTVLGRDVFTEIVYKGFLYPLGHRASLIKVTERTYFVDPADGVQRAYLRQRMFIRCSKPLKVFPAVGQPNGGRSMPADRISVLTVQTPDIVDPYYGQGGQSGSATEATLLPSGRITLGSFAGLAFFPRTALIDGAEVRFELDIAGHFTDMPLIFVDNTAANSREALALLQSYYNAKIAGGIPSPDIEGEDIAPIRHKRSIRFDGSKIRYADEITSGSASIETDAWTLAVEGRENRLAPTDLAFKGGAAGSKVRIFGFDNTSYAFTPLLQGVDQPPFYPVLDTARVQLRQVERLTGKALGSVRVRFDGHYIANGLPLAIPDAEVSEEKIAADIENASRAIGNGSQIFLINADPKLQDMGAQGDNSGGVFRPKGEVVALSRSKGAVTLGDKTVAAFDLRRHAVPPPPGGNAYIADVAQPSLAAAFDALPPTAKPQKKPIARPEDVPATRSADPIAGVTEDLKKLREFFQEIFDSDAKILGLVSIKDLLKLLMELSGDGKDGPPELVEQVQYGAGQLGEAADDATNFLKDSVLRPVDRALTVIRESWTDIDEDLHRLQNVSSAVIQPVTLQELFPELFAGLRSLQAAVQSSLEIEDGIEFALSLSEVYEAGQRFLNAVQATATNPVERFENAFVSRVNVIQALTVDFADALPKLAEDVLDPLKDEVAQRIALFLIPPPETRASGRGAVALRREEANAPFTAFPILLPRPPDVALQEAFELAFPTRGFVRGVIEEFVGIVLTRLQDTRLQNDQKLDLEQILTSTAGEDLVNQVREHLDERLEAAQTKLEEFATDTAAEYARTIAGLQSLIEAEANRYFDILVDHLVRELDPLLRFADAVQKVANTLETTPINVELALQHALEAVEVLTGDLNFDVASICRPKPVADALESVAKAFDPSRLAFYQISIGTIPVEPCEGFDDPNFTVVSPELFSALKGWNDKIAEVKAAVAPGPIQESFDGILESDEFDDIPDAQKSEIEPLIRAANATALRAADKIDETADDLLGALTDLHCDLVDDAVRLKGLGEAFQTALADLADLCTDPTAVVQRLSKQTAAFLRGRRQMLDRTMRNLAEVSQALEGLAADPNVQTVAAAGGIAGLVKEVIEAVIARVPPGGQVAELNAFLAEAEKRFTTIREQVDAVIADYATRALEAMLQLAMKMRALVVQLNLHAREIQDRYDAISQDLRRFVQIETNAFAEIILTASGLQTFFTALEAALQRDVTAARANPDRAMDLLLAQAERKTAPSLDVPTFWVQVNFVQRVPVDEDELRSIFYRVEEQITEFILSYSEAVDRAFGVLTAEIEQQLDRLVTFVIGNPADGLRDVLLIDKPSLGQDYKDAKFGLVWALYLCLQDLRNKVLQDNEAAAALLKPVLLVDKRDGTPADDVTFDDRLAEDVRLLQAAFTDAGDGATPVSNATHRAFLKAFVTEWTQGNSTPLLILRGVQEVFADLIRGNIIQQFPFDQIRDQIEEELRALVPTKVEMKYAFGAKLNPGMKAATAGIFEPLKGSSFTVNSVIAIDIGSGRPEVSFRSEGVLGKFDINLVGSFDAIKLKFNGARFVTENGADPRFDVDYSDYVIGKELEFVQQLQSYFTPKDGSGFYLEPLFSPIGIEAGYDLPLGTISIGTASFFNVAISAAARLPFDNDEARFRGSLSRRSAPFTVSIAPYGGSGFFAIEANTKGIVGFEASFEFGGAGAFAFGPLTGQGRLMAGVYVRQTQVPGRGKVTEISGTFFAGGSANIWIFSFGSSLYVRLGMVNGDMSGEAVFTFSFSMGIKDFEFSVEVWRQEGKGFESSSQASLPPPGTRLAGHLIAGASFVSRDASDLIITDRVPQVEVDVVPKSQSWREYRRYFDNRLRVEEVF